MSPSQVRRSVAEAIAYQWALDTATARTTEGARIWAQAHGDDFEGPADAAIAAFITAIEEPSEAMMLTVCTTHAPPSEPCQARINQRAAWRAMLAQLKQEISGT